MIEKIAEVEGGLQEETTYDGRKLRWSEDARKGLWTMKNAYQRRRTKARVEKRARMKKLDAITLDFAREVIEEETGTPLDIVAQGALTSSAATSASPAGTPASGSAPAPAASDGVKLVARDERKNPLISIFDWTDEATQRIFRVPAGFMRSQTQERIEALAHERAAAGGTGEAGVVIDLALVEDGIEIGKRMMAEMIANYPSAGQGHEKAAPAAAGHSSSASTAPAQEAPAVNGSGYLNEVSALSARRVE